MRHWVKQICKAVLLLVCLLTGIVGVAQVEGADRPGQANRLFPKGAPPAEVVDVVDLRSASPDTKLAAITLQGHINAPPTSQVYLLLAGNTNDAFWLEQLKRKGHLRATRSLSSDAYFKEYADRCSLVVVYDPALPATINVATMIASLQSGMVVAPDDLDKHRQQRSVIDLRGRWKTNVDAYDWAFEELWPQMNQDILACFHPTSIPHYIRDYLVRNRIFTFWITSKEKEDGVTSSQETETRFAEKLFRASKVNIPVIGFWYSGQDGGISEYAGVGLAGEYGKLTVVCDWATNLSLLSGIDVDFKKLALAHKARAQVARQKLDLSKVYVCFDIVESGDAPMYWQGAQLNVWRDPKRGTIPIGWSVGPTVIELMPPIMEWFYEQAGANDYFYMSLSGACYVHPYRHFMSKTPDPEAAWKGYLNLTAYYMDMLCLREVSLYTDAWRPFDRSQQDPITQKFIDGLPNVETLIMGMGRDGDRSIGNYLMQPRDVLVSHVATRWDGANVGRSPKNNEWLANEIRQHTPEDRPAFVHVHPLSWSYYPSDLAAVLKALGEGYVAVTPPELKRLYLESLKRARRNDAGQ